MSDKSLALTQQSTLEDFVSFFETRGIRHRVIVDDPFLQVLRLIVSSRCGRGCHFPDGSAVWCHVEGITNRGRNHYGLDDMLVAAAWLRNRTGIDQVKIAGLEPRFDESFIPFIRGLRASGFDRISITTHDDELLRHLDAYHQAGLTQLSVSIPHFDDAEFARVTFNGTATGLIGLVRRARELGLDPVKVNRVLQRGTTDDLPRVLDFVRENRIAVKLFDLMWTRRAAGHLSRFQVSWTEFAHLWLEDVDEVSLYHYPRSHRTRVCFALTGGGSVEANIMDDKQRAEASVCGACAHSAVCAEGYLGCGVRVLPDLTVLPCLLRPELALDISEAVTSSGRNLDAAMEELVAGRPLLHPADPAFERQVLRILPREETA